VFSGDRNYCACRLHPPGKGLLPGAIKLCRQVRINPQSPLQFCDSGGDSACSQANFLRPAGDRGLSSSADKIGKPSECVLPRRFEDVHHKVQNAATCGIAVVVPDAARFIEPYAVAVSVAPPGSAAPASFGRSSILRLTDVR
jgi:hypothetical protein